MQVDDPKELLRELTRIRDMVIADAAELMHRWEPMLHRDDFRASAENLQASAVLDIVSAGNGAVAPGPSPKEYVVYFYPPQTAAGSAQDGLAVAFDLVNFNPADSSFATLQLHDVRIDAFDVPLMP